MPDVRLFDSTVHRSGELRLQVPRERRLFRVPSRPALAQLSPGDGLPGVSSLIATSTVRVHLPQRVPSLRYVPPAGFLSLSAVCSALRLCGLVSSHSHVQGCWPVQGLLSSRSASLLSEGAAPLSFDAWALTDQKPAATPKRLDSEASFRVR